MVYLLGCDHYLQEYELTESDSDLCALERRSKEHFYELTKKIVESQQIRFVGEECKPSQKTIPRELAIELECAYAEIDMPVVERERIGIARNYQALGEEERSRVYDIREDYMVQRVYSESSMDARKLIVCGAEHLKGLETRFRQRCEMPTVRNLIKEDWVLDIYKKKEEFLLGLRVNR